MTLWILGSLTRPVPGVWSGTVDIVSGNYAIVEASTGDSLDIRKFNTAGTFGSGILLRQSLDCSMDCDIDQVLGNWRQGCWSQ